MATHIHHQPPLWRQLQATAQVVAAVRAGVSGTAALEQVAPDLRPGVQALAFHTWRQLGRAQALRDQLVRRAPPAGIDALLCTALALTWNAEQAPYDGYTLVNQAVEAAKRSPALRAQAAFLNGCLRSFLRDPARWVAQTAGDLQAHWNHPLWWIERLRRERPQDWETVLEASNAHPRMALRVNTRKASSTAYAASLRSAGFAGVCASATTLYLETPVAVQRLPGFLDGVVSVQDAAAQHAAPLLLAALSGVAQPRVLDACAAPGGKTGHLLEASDARVTALEIDVSRAGRIVENLQRLGLSAQVLTADAAAPASWWDGIPFDGVLLDAPCTASGIVRRHPDVRWLRRESDIGQLAEVQRRLLHALWALVRPGGYLLYCTCSVFRAEGAEQTQAFLSHHTDACLCPSPGHWMPQSCATMGPLTDNLLCDHDGFYYALLEKRRG